MGSAHCVNCGQRLIVAASQQTTQFGMPLLRPSPVVAKGGGHSTTQFGPEEIAALAQAGRESTPVPSSPVAANLMAGMPRPRVSSAASPLTATSTGLRSALTPAPTPMPASRPPAARPTVMGMPPMGPGSLPPAAAAPVLSAGRGAAPIVDFSSIQSLDVFDPDAVSPARGETITEVTSAPPRAAPSMAASLLEPLSDDLSRDWADGVPNEGPPFVTVSRSVPPGEASLSAPGPENEAPSTDKLAALDEATPSGAPPSAPMLPLILAALILAAAALAYALLRAA